MPTIKIHKIGNDYGFIFPKEIIDKYNLEEREKLQLIEKNDGFTLVTYQSEFEKWNKLLKKTNENFRNILNELSK